MAYISYIISRALLRDPKRSVILYINGLYNAF